MKRLLAALLALCLALPFALPVFAQATQPQPDSMEILSARGFYDLAETGDASIFVHWKIDYPDAYTSDNYNDLNPASIAIQMELYDTDGTTLLATARPYVYGPFEVNGYEQGVSNFYFSAADNLTTSQAYLVRIQQSALYFASPVSENYTMIVATDWADASQDDFYDHVMQVADLMLAEYPDVYLKTATEIGIVFSTHGESYFRAAVPGIQQICPQLFYVQDYLPEEMPVTAYTTDLQDQYSIRMQGSEIKRGADRLAAHFGVSGYFILGFVILATCIGSGIYTSKKGWGLEPGLIGASIIAVGGALLIGNAVFTIVMIGTLVAVIALFFTFLGRRA